MDTILCMKDNELLSFAGAGKVDIGASIKLSCTAYAIPIPRVFWRVRMPNKQGVVANATCNNGEGTIRSTANPNTPGVNPRSQYVRSPLPYHYGPSL